MTRENIKAQCRKISADFSEKSVCKFVKDEEALGFVDTSQNQNGSRGIAFFEDKAVVNFGGEPVWIYYNSIKSVHVISSFEDFFSDELTISCGDIEVRISDCSLDKSELKRLLDELCVDDARSRERKDQAEKLAEIIAENLAESALHSDASEAIEREEAAGEHPDNFPEYAPVQEEFPEETLPEKTDDLTDIVFEDGAPVISETVIHKEYRPAPIPNDKIDWISGVSGETVPAEFEEFEEEAAARIRIQNMSAEETMSYLAESLNEINGVSEAPKPAEEPADLQTISDYSPVPEEEAKPNALTVEPIWGDIYIKASRNLRELCESGKLTMEQIETELNDKLLNSARAFADVTSDNSKVPKVLIPKITELKAAAENFDQYFQSGEDIAVRAMFFMMYQMLSYADRIVESSETKSRLNDFFRRFGPAGITLSMLDMRV